MQVYTDKMHGVYAYIGMKGSGAEHAGPWFGLHVVVLAFLMFE